MCMFTYVTVSRYIVAEITLRISKVMVLKPQQDIVECEPLPYSSHDVTTHISNVSLFTNCLAKQQMVYSSRKPGINVGKKIKI